MRNVTKLQYKKLLKGFKFRQALRYIFGGIGVIGFMILAIESNGTIMVPIGLILAMGCMVLIVLGGQFEYWFEQKYTICETWQHALRLEGYTDEEIKAISKEMKCLINDPPC